MVLTFSGSGVRTSKKLKLSPVVRPRLRMPRGHRTVGGQGVELCWGACRRGLFQSGPGRGQGVWG